jgi:hypothetical protein
MKRQRKASEQIKEGQDIKGIEPQQVATVKRLKTDYELECEAEGDQEDEECEASESQNDKSKSDSLTPDSQPAVPINLHSQRI